jgi:hypothetical protein
MIDINLNLTPWQYEFLNSDKLILALSGGSNTGKSWICRLKMIMNSLKVAGTQSFVTASTYTQTTRAVIDPMILFLKEQNIPHVADFEKGEGILRFINGSHIEIFSAEKMMFRLRSREFSLGFIEEAITIPEKDIQEIVDESNRRLRPPSPGPYHLLLATNPGLKNSWLYGNVYGPNAPDDTWSRHIPFYEGYNKNDKEYEKKLLRASKRERQIFYHGEWGVLEGQVLNLYKNIYDCPPVNDGSKFHIAFDYGFAPDPMVYLLIENLGSNLVVREELELKEVPVTKHSQYLDQWFQNYNISAFTGDNSPGCSEVRNLLQNKYQLSYYPTRKLRSEGWSTLVDLFDRNLITFDNIKRCIESLESLTWMPNKMDVNAGDDHHADALRYYIMSNLYGYRMEKDESTDRVEGLQIHVTERVTGVENLNFTLR